jgi:hypothetical protein
MNDYTMLNTLAVNVWNIFSVFNGNPDTNNFGIRLGIGIFFSIFLLIIIKMRTISTMDKKHIVAMIGALFIFFRYAVMLIFEWGYQIGIYDDPFIKFLFPPIEHYFYMIGLGCLAYYSLNHYQYYPGILRKIVWTIPVFITGFFVYATISWKILFMNSLPIVKNYIDCNVDWQSHVIVAVMALYVFFVSMVKPSRTNNHWLSYFWLLTLFEHGVKSILFYQHMEPSWIATIFHSFEIWSLPLMTLHFIKVYVVKLKYCEICNSDPHKVL